MAGIAMRACKKSSQNGGIWEGLGGMVLLEEILSVCANFEASEDLSHPQCTLSLLLGVQDVSTPPWF